VDAYIIVLLSLAPVVALVLCVVGGYIGVRGALRATNRILSEHSDDLASLDTRLSRLQRQRASDASVEAREATKSLHQEAVDRLTAEQHSGGRPSIVRN